VRLAPDDAVEENDLKMRYTTASERAENTQNGTSFSASGVRSTAEMAESCSGIQLTGEQGGTPAGGGIVPVPLSSGL